MIRVRALMLLAAAGLAAPVAAQVNGFSFVNNSGGAMTGLAVRRVGSDEWHPLVVAPTGGTRIRAAFTDPDCAFDIRADVAGKGPVVWTGVNLCDASNLTLNRDESGRAWVDYD